MPAFFGGQLLTMPRAVFIGLLASQMADLLWKIISSHLSKDYKYKQTEAKTVAVFEILQIYPPFLPVSAGVLLRHIPVGLASVRGGSYRNLPLMTKIWVSTNMGLDLSLQLMSCTLLTNDRFAW